jgi:hypothetical protein
MTTLLQNLSPAYAAHEAQRLFSGLIFRDLFDEQTLEAGTLAAERQGVRGSNFHDFLHVRAAEIFGATCIITLNIADFRMMIDLPFELPLQGGIGKS